MDHSHNRLARPASAIPQPFPWVASLLYLGALFAEVYYRAAGLCGNVFLPGRVARFAGVILLLLALEQFERRRYTSQAPRPVAVTLLVARMVLFELVVPVDCSGFTKLLYLIVPFVAYFSLGKAASYSLAVFYVGLFVFRLWSFTPEWYLNREYVSDLLIFAIGLVFAISMAAVVRGAEASRAHAEQLLDDLAASHQKLRAYAEQVAELAATEERNRLARDIHDSLGHYLTVVTIQLEKAIAFRQRNPEEAEQALWDARRSARQALQDVRQSVGALRQSPEFFSLSAALDELVKDVANGRLAINLEISGEESGFPRLALLSLYRAAQEGLTNVQKHAQASQVSVRVTLNDQEASLCVRDDGQGFDPAVLEHLPSNRQEHFGLQGVRERLELVGGTMTVESSPNGGTQLSVTIPKRPLVVERATAGSEGAL
ncbi:MAG: sensor histidine kinase [Chloroflexi bacterium]|nr:sensor histidine kinase [Chloroflexota bacterium]